jgi:hypothetical protein
MGGGEEKRSFTRSKIGWFLNSINAKINFNLAKIVFNFKAVKRNNNYPN